MTDQDTALVEVLRRALERVDELPFHTYEEYEEDARTMLAALSSPEAREALRVWLGIPRDIHVFRHHRSPC